MVSRPLCLMDATYQAHTGLCSSSFPQYKSIQISIHVLYESKSPKWHAKKRLTKSRVKNAMIRNTQHLQHQQRPKEAIFVCRYKVTSSRGENL